MCHRMLLDVVTESPSGDLQPESWQLSCSLCIEADVASLPIHAPEPELQLFSSTPIPCSLLLRQLCDKHDKTWDFCALGCQTLRQDCEVDQYVQEEAQGNTENVPKIIKAAIKSLQSNSVVIDRDYWLKVISLQPHPSADYAASHILILSYVSFV